MMIEIRHRTTYTYNPPARLDLQTIRLKPRADARQRVLSFDLEVSPTPVFKSEGIDEEGNVMVWVRVDGELTYFEIRMTARVETVPATPEKGLLAPGAARLPLQLPTDSRSKLQPYFMPPWVDPSVKVYANEIAQSANWSTLEFLEALALRIHKGLSYRARLEGPPWTPDVTLARRQGTCRDFTVLFMEACRALGIATRFVSGYHVRDRDNTGHELHAWAEAFLPGFGWQGYDPIIGKIVQDRHVAVATAAIPIGAAPIMGSFWGNNVRSTLQASVDVRVVTNAATFL